MESSRGKIIFSISSGLNIFLDWLFVFPMQMGVMGAAVATLCMNYTLMAALC